ncbi:hypothetical protein IWQ62_001152 [Dispira parvispora]|uniref:Uncharacterized protein n=1 Tax=Dispira parvispora TaxID=1520584 RepID=A0A9W8AYK5_9FUNG|nr:hypothetical protein IWQ62_001152 [Dispira parvispora]
MIADTSQSEASQFVTLETIVRISASLGVVGSLGTMVRLRRACRTAPRLGSLIFLAALADLVDAGAKLATRFGIRAGVNSPGCQIQAALIQWATVVSVACTVAIALQTYATRRDSQLPRVAAMVTLIYARFRPAPDVTSEKDGYRGKHQEVALIIRAVVLTLLWFPSLITRFYGLDHDSNITFGLAVYLAIISPARGLFQAALQWYLDVEYPLAAFSSWSCPDDKGRQGVNEMEEGKEFPTEAVDDWLHSLITRWRSRLRHPSQLRRNPPRAHQPTVYRSNTITRISTDECTLQGPSSTIPRLSNEPPIPSVFPTMDGAMGLKIPPDSKNGPKPKETHPESSIQLLAAFPGVDNLKHRDSVVDGISHKPRRPSDAKAHPSSKASFQLYPPASPHSLPEDRSSVTRKDSYHFPDYLGYFLKANLVASTPHLPSISFTTNGSDHRRLSRPSPNVHTVMSTSMKRQSTSFSHLLGRISPVTQGKFWDTASKEDVDHDILQRLSYHVMIPTGNSNTNEAQSRGGVRMPSISKPYGETSPTRQPSVVHQGRLSHGSNRLLADFVVDFGNGPQLDLTFPSEIESKQRR